MDAFAHMARTLETMAPRKLTRKEQQREWNRRYYERNRERFGWVHHAVTRLIHLRNLIAEPA